MGDSEWHLDKRVPLALIVALVVQTGVVFTWKANVDNRLTALEATDVIRASHESRLIIIEQAIPRIDESLREIKGILRRERMGAIQEPGRL